MNKLWNSARWIIGGMLIAAVVLGTLNLLDRFDEIRAEQEAAARLEPNLKAPPAPECGVVDGEPTCWSPSPTPAITMADFGPANGAVANSRTGEMTALFLYSPGERRDVLNNDFRWVYINLRDGGSIKIDRETSHAWFCPVDISVLGPDDKAWCGPTREGMKLEPWQMIPTPGANYGR